MSLRVGSLIWMQCEAKQGTFSDERFVRVRSDFGEWYGFVPIESLRDEVAEGSTFVCGTVVGVQNDRFEVQLPGDPLTSGIFHGSIARLTPLGSVEAGYSPLSR